MTTNYPRPGAMYVDQKVPGFNETISYLWSHAHPKLGGASDAPKSLWQGAFRQPGIADQLKELIKATAAVYATAGSGQVASATEREIRKIAERIAEAAVPDDNRHFLHINGDRVLAMNEAARFADVVFSYAGNREGSNPSAEQQRGRPSADPFITKVLANVSWDGTGLTDDHIAAVGALTTVYGLDEKDLTSPKGELEDTIPAAKEALLQVAQDASKSVFALETVPLVKDSLG